MKRLLSALLVCVMSLNLVALHPMAAQYNNYSFKTVELNDKTYNLYVTDNRTGQIDLLRVSKNNDGICSSQGWIDIGNLDEYQTRNPDFQVIVNENQILYKDSNGTDKIVGIVNQGINNKMLRIPSTPKITYPTDWYADETFYSSVGTDLGNVLSVAVILLTVGGLGVAPGLVMSIATIIVSNKIPIVYYAKTRYSRVLSPCEQEYYYEVQWYKDAARTELIGTSKGTTEVVNLC